MGDPGRQGSEYCLSKWLSAFWSKMIKLKLNLFAEFRITNDDIFTVWILDSGFHVLDSVIRVLNSEFFVSRTWILDVIVKGIPESLSCISDSKAQFSGSYKQNFQIPLHWALPSFVACVAGAWKKWAQKRTGAREGDTRVSLARPFFLAPARQATSLASCLPIDNPAVTILSGIIFKTYSRGIPQIPTLWQTSLSWLNRLLEF